MAKAIRGRDSATIDRLLRDNLNELMAGGFKGPDGDTLLHLAAWTGDVEVISRLVGGGADLEARDKSGFTPLACAIETENSPTISRLLELGANPNVRNSAGNVLLHRAVQTDRTDLVQALIAGKADVNAANCFLDTPLHMVARSGNSPMVRTLLETPGVETDIYNMYNQSPLLVAASSAARGSLLSPEDPIWNTLFEKTVSEQMQRLEERLDGKPLYAITPVRNLEATIHAAKWLPLDEPREKLRAQAMELHARYQAKLAERTALAGVDAEIAELRSLVAPDKWDATMSQVLADRRMRSFALDCQHPVTRCASTVGVVAWYLMTRETADGEPHLLKAHYRPTQQGVASLRNYLDADATRFFHCCTDIKDANQGSAVVLDHTFVIERVSEGRYRIYQSYLASITLREVLGRAAYGSLEGGDLSREDLEQFLVKIEHLEKATHWTTEEHRLYRDLFHASTVARPDGLSFSFYSSNDPKPSLRETVTCGVLPRSSSLMAADPGELLEVDSRGNTVFHAVKHGVHVLPSLFMIPGAETIALWSQNDDGQTPLTAAVARGDIASAHLLIQQGADQDMPDGSGRSAVQIAADQGNSAMLTMLEATRKSAPIPDSFFLS
jgi:ankyrin repeat protein